MFDNYLAKPPAVRGGARRGTEDRRVPLRGLRRRTSPRSAPTSTRRVSRYTLVPTLVRGLDYYSRTTFEFIGPTENQNSTITGGGRYDYLVEEIGGPPTPGIGFGAGIERLLIAMEEEGVEPRRAEADRRVPRARRRGAPRPASRAGSPSSAEPGSPRETDYAGRSLKGQLTQARRLGARAHRRGRPETATLRVAGPDGRAARARRDRL